MPSNSRHGLAWTVAEKTYLEQNAHLPARTIGEALGRSRQSVNSHRVTLGLAKATATRPSRALVRSLAEKWAPEAKCTVPQVLADHRERHVAWARWQVMRELVDQGYSRAGVARVLGMNHASVINGLKRCTIPCPPPKLYPAKKPKPVRMLPPPPPPPVNHAAVLESSLTPPSKARLMGAR